MAEPPSSSSEDTVELALVQISGEGDSALRHIRELIFEYTQYLLNHECDVGSFQDLEVELKELPGRYSREHGGCLLVLYPGQSSYVRGMDVVHRELLRASPDGPLKEGGALACVAVKALAEPGKCEMKRMFVREPFRRLGLGRLLARAAVREATRAGRYDAIRLDSLERLPAAIPLYEGLGFKRCEAYVPNPEQDAVFLEMMLPVRAPEGKKEYEEAAQIFAAAKRVPNTAVASLPPVGSIQDAYGIHSALARCVGAPVAGWKVGASNEAALKRLGLTEAFRGPLFSPSVRRGPCMVDWEELGAAVSAIEVEFAFTMSAALGPRPEPYTEEEVWGAVGTMHPALELAASRVPSLLPARPETVHTCIADFALGGGLVLGGGIPRARLDPETLAALSATVSRTGARGGGMSAQGKGANVMGGPLVSLCWLVNTLRADGITLEEGAVVTTGAAALLTADQVPWGQECTLEASLGGLPAELGECSVKVQLPEI